MQTGYGPVYASKYDEIDVKKNEKKSAKRGADGRITARFSHGDRYTLIAAAVRAVYLPRGSA